MASLDGMYLVAKNMMVQAVSYANQPPENVRVFLPTAKMPERALTHTSFLLHKGKITIFM